MTNEQRQFIWERVVFSIDETGKIGYLHLKKESRRRPYMFYKVYSKWIVDLNIIHKAIELLEENLGNLGFGDEFLTFIYFWETERQSSSRRQAEREGDIESEAGSRLSALSMFQVC